MKLGVFTALFRDKSFEQMLDYVAHQGLKAVEIGTGGYPGDRFCRPEELLRDAGKRKTFVNEIDRHGLEISALSCHGNPLHPDRNIARQAHNTFQATVRLAAEIGVKTVNMFSGCPGESDHSLNPVWVTCAWPPEYREVSRWQWGEKVIPYWSDQNEFLREHNVRVAIEPHPGFVVYNTETALRLRTECGEFIGVNFDPSHLFWQGADVVLNIRELGNAGAIFHVHAKDTYLDRHNVARNGVLDIKNYQSQADRSWYFRTVGYGHSEEVWRDIISSLKLAGYSGAISIEHEDALMSEDEGLKKAVAFLNKILITEQPSEVWWS